MQVHHVPAVPGGVWCDCAGGGQGGQAQPEGHPVSSRVSGPAYVECHADPADGNQRSQQCGWQDGGHTGQRRRAAAEDARSWRRHGAALAAGGLVVAGGSIVQLGVVAEGGG